MQAEVQKWREEADIILAAKPKFADPNRRVV
jgi:hypothetical protein